MNRGISLIELLMVVVIVATVVAISVPRAAGMLDHLAADAAARDVTNMIAVARHLAIAQGRRVRLQFTTDSIRLDTLGAPDWGRYVLKDGPASRGVTLQSSNPVMTITPLGLMWGVSNTTISLRRGSHLETVVVSKVGRVRRG